MKNLIRTTIIVCFIPLSLVGQAEEWNGAVSTNQIVRDSSSVAEARILAVKQLQFDAARQAGAIVIKTEKLVGGRFSEIIELVSAAEVKLSNMNEGLNVQNGILRLTVSADAAVDLERLNGRLSYILENNDLHNLLSELNTKYLAVLNRNSFSDTNDLPLVSMYEGLAARWLGLNELNALSEYSKVKIATVESELLSDIYGEIIQHGKVKSVIESVVDSGSNFDVYVRIGLDFDLDRISDVAGKYWDIRIRKNYAHPFVMIIGSKPQSQNIPVSLNNIAFNFLAEHNLVMAVTVANDRKEIPLSYLGNDFMAGCRIQKPKIKSTVYCFSTIDENKMAQLPSVEISNPLKFSIPKTSITKIKPIEVKSELVVRSVM